MYTFIYITEVFMTHLKKLSKYLLIISLIISLFTCGESGRKPEEQKKFDELPTKNDRPAKYNRKHYKKTDRRDKKSSRSKEFSDSDDSSAATKGFSESDEEKSDRDGKGEDSPTYEKKRTTYSRPRNSGLKAGFVDDNKQFNYFAHFINRFKHQLTYYNLNINERIIISLKDRNGNSLANARILIYNSRNHVVYSGTTYADGTFLFFPRELKTVEYRYKALAIYNNHRKYFTIYRFGNRNITVRFPIHRKKIQNVPLDMLFILDTTGSMGKEIQRLKSTIDIIYLNASNFSSKPRVRFGMVLYKDRGDEYITKIIPLTSNLKKFRKDLDQIDASGGGDAPEDLQQALYDTIHKIQWRKDGIRLGFIITDAPPHLDYGQRYTYAHASRDAKQQAIKLFTIGTGGLPLQGEFVLRQIAQYTSANYIFLHYGEKGESEGGRAGSVSHHTGANYQVDKLESIVIRATKKELSHLTNQPLHDGQEYFIAHKIPKETKKDTLNQLFSKAIKQLVDYSSLSIDQNTPASVLPISTKSSSLKVDAEYFTEQLILSFAQQRVFKLIDRELLQKIIQEQAIQNSELYDESKSVKIGKLIGAKMLISSKLYKIGKYNEMIIKLIRVETGEILSVTKVKISHKLGLRA